MQQEFRDPPSTGSAETAVALEVEDLHVRFAAKLGTVHAVDGVSLTLEAGKVLGIVGESGSGKSVLVKAVMQLLPKHNTAVDGRIIANGTDLMALDGNQMRQHWGADIAMVFQDALTALNPVMKVGPQIVEQIRAHDKGISKAEARRRAIALLSEVGIPDPARRAKQYPHQLSGGMRQRVMIALALSCDPSLLLADEPTTALDVTIQAQVMELLRHEQTNRNMAMVLITHDLGIAAKYTDELIVMYGGQVVEKGPTSVVLGRKLSPYTDALYKASPRLANPPHTRLQTLTGRPPTVFDRSPGCRFAPRCQSAQARCLVERPDLASDTTSSEEHLYRCFFPIGTPEGDAAIAHNRGAGVTAAGVKVS